MLNKSKIKEDMMYVTKKKNYYRDLLDDLLEKINYYHSIKMSGKQFLIRYFQYHLDQREQQLTGVKKENYYELQSFFSELELKRFFPKQHWTLVFTNAFIKSLCEISEDDALLILVLLNLLIKGKFYNYKSKVFQNKKYHQENYKFPYIYNYLFGTIQESYLNTAIQIIPNQYPIYNEEGIIQRFEFIHDIILIDIVPYDSKNPILYYNIEQYFRAQYTAPDFFQKMQLVNEDRDYEYKVNKSVKIGEKSELIQYKVLPRRFKPIILQGNDEYVYDERMKKWITKKAQELYNKKFENLQEFSNNYYLIQKYCITPSTFYLQKIVENIPNFRVKLTTEQLEAISHSGDTLVIGRSGTGKTTCALLKLFATDTLFKLRMKLDLIKNNQIQISLNQNQGELQLKTIFITASPVLACQIKRLYLKLVNDIQESLNQKKYMTHHQ